ncbi:MAG: lysozyme inhibitor LprI family protein [Pseudomonadota bacterium]
MIIQTLMPLLVLQASAPATPPNPEWNCDDPQYQQEMNWCAGQRFVEADTALNAQWAITADEMKARDASYAEFDFNTGDDRPGWFASLLEAQRAWIKFRDAHCRVDGYTARGGTLEPLLVSSCKTALTLDRTEQLRALATAPF